MWALAGIALFVTNIGWVIVVGLLLVVLVILKHILGVLRERRAVLLLEQQIQDSKAREAGYRADIEDIQWQMSGLYEGQYPGATMPLTEDLIVVDEGDRWRVQRNMPLTRREDFLYGDPSTWGLYMDGRPLR